MLKVGFIGLGSMGKPMVLNLLEAGFSVAAYARNPNIIDPSLKSKLKLYLSPNELAFNSQVVIIMVTSAESVEELILGQNGIIHGARPDTIIIDMSTISPTITQKIAKTLSNNQVEMLDAPVSGDIQQAEKGTLTLMVGGKRKILSKVKPILTTLGTHITHVGDHGAGQLAKACHQLIAAETLIAIDESLQLAKGMSINLTKLYHALKTSSIRSPILIEQCKRMIEKNYTPGFKAGLHRQDMHVALDQAHLHNVNLPAAKYAAQCLDRLVMKGHSELDSAAIHLLVEEK